MVRIGRMATLTPASSKTRPTFSDMPVTKNMEVE